MTIRSRFRFTTSHDQMSDPFADRMFPTDFAAVDDQAISQPER